MTTTTYKSNHISPTWLLKFSLTLSVFGLACDIVHADDYDFQNKSHKFEVTAGYLPTLQSYDLSGTGFKTNYDGVSGTGYSGSVKYNHSSANYTLDFFSVTHALSSPAGLTPTKIDSTFKRYAFTMQPKSASTYGDESNDKAFNMDYGIEIRQRSADATLPNRFMANQNTAGVRVGGTYFKSLNDLTFLNGRAGLYVPLYQDELDGKTGFYRFSINPDVGLTVNRKLGTDVEISAGLWAFYEIINYSGTGDRGTSKAKETYLNLMFPIDFKIKF